MSIMIHYVVFYSIKNILFSMAKYIKAYTVFYCFSSREIPSFFKVYCFVGGRGEQRQREGEIERERERERIPKFQSGSTLSVWSPMRGSKTWTLRSWPEPKLRVRCLTDRATHALQNSFFWLKWLKNFPI